MGSTTMALWHKGETARIKEWFGRIKVRDNEIEVPRVPFREDIALAPYNHGDSGIWVEFRSNLMSLDCSIWDDIGKAYATLIIQELAKKHRLKNAGWDAVGYCLDCFLRSEGLLIRPFRNKIGLEKLVEHTESTSQFLREEAVKLVVGV